jgi:hypothetical protein
VSFLKGFAVDTDMSLFEASAKDGVQIYDAFKELTQQLKQKADQKSSRQNSNDE